MKKLFAALALAAVVVPKVEGVSKTDVSFDKRQAVVTFDDAKTNVQKLTKATEDAGYPSSLKR